MAKNVRFTLQQRQTHRPLPDAPVSSGDQAFVIDDQSFWTGKEFLFDIKNKSAFPRWYRVVVTNLSPGRDYTLFSQYGSVTPNDLFEVSPADAHEISLVLGGDAEKEPDAPRDFQVYVQQFSTRDESDPPRVLMDTRLKWIPRPGSDSLYVTTQTKMVRLRPWQRHIRFGASLVNRGFLPVSAVVRAQPEGDDKGSGIEGTQEALNEAVPAQTEQPLLCDIVLDHSLKDAVTISVDAEAQIPTLGVSQSVTPTLVEVVPVPLLRAWQDWAVVAALLFLLVWGLFGMPPISHPGTDVTLNFPDGMPAGLHGRDLKVTLTPGEKNSPAVQEFATAVGEPLENQKDALTYHFQWPWAFNGFRWSWRVYPLQLHIEPRGKDTPDLTAYQIPDQTLQAGGKDITIAMGQGVFPPSGVAPIPRQKGVSVVLKVDAKDLGNDPDVSVKLTVDNTPLPDITIVSNRTPEPIWIPEDKLKGADHSGTVVVDATALPSNRHKVMQLLVKSAPYPFVTTLLFGTRTGDLTIQAGNPVTPFQYKVSDMKGAILASGHSGGQAVPISIPISDVSKKVQVAISCNGKPLPIQTSEIKPDAIALVDWAPPIEIGQIVGGPVDKPKIGGNTDGGHQGGGNTPRGPKIVDPPVPHVPPSPVQGWAEMLHAGGFADGLIKERANGAPHLAVHLTHKAGIDYELSITPSKECWIQIYQIVTNRSVSPFLGRDGDTNIYLSKADEDKAFPWRLQADKLRRFPWSSSGEDHLVVLAYSGDADPASDLLPLLLGSNPNEMTGFAIEGIKVTP